MTRRLTRHSFDRAFWLSARRGGRMAEAPAPPPLADLLPPPPRAAPRPAVKLDLRNAPSSMEILAESWRAKG